MKIPIFMQSLEKIMYADIILSLPMLRGHRRKNFFAEKLPTKLNLKSL